MPHNYKCGGHLVRVGWSWDTKAKVYVDTLAHLDYIIFRCDKCNREYGQRKRKKKSAQL